VRRARVNLLGRVLNDPELYFTPSGEAVVRFDVGTTLYGLPTVEEPVARHRCLVWNRGERNLADLVLENLRRGAALYVEGRLQELPAVALRCAGDPWQIEVSDVQLLVERRRPARDRFEASRSSTLAPG
jgi:single-stranded DNA-binding protein